MGIEDFSSIIPEPPDMDAPRKPDEEWNLMLEGRDDIHPNPADHDDAHLMAHQKQLEEATKDPNVDMQAVNLMIGHIRETNQQKRTKMLMQVLTNQLMQQAASDTHPAVQQMLGQAMGQPQEMGGPQQQPGAGAGSSAAPQPQDGML
jgi:hypothetical protein